jgi:hypothetical protein
LNLINWVINGLSLKITIWSYAFNHIIVGKEEGRGTNLTNQNFKLDHIKIVKKKEDDPILW